MMEEEPITKPSHRPGTEEAGAYTFARLDMRQFILGQEASHVAEMRPDALSILVSEAQYESEMAAGADEFTRPEKAPDYPPFPSSELSHPDFKKVYIEDGNPHPLMLAVDRQGTTLHKSLSRLSPGTIRSSLIHQLLLSSYGKTPADGMHCLKNPNHNPFTGNIHTRHGVMYEPLGLSMIRELVLYCARNKSGCSTWKPSDLLIQLDHYYAHWDPSLRHVYCSPDAEMTDRVSQFKGLFVAAGMSEEEAREWCCDRVTVELKHPSSRMYSDHCMKEDHMCQTQFQADCSRCKVALYVAVFIPREQRFSRKPRGPERVHLQVWACRHSSPFCSWMSHNLKAAKEFALDPTTRHEGWAPRGAPPFDKVVSRRLFSCYVDVSESSRREWRDRLLTYREQSGELSSILADHGVHIPAATLSRCRSWEDLEREMGVSRE